MQGSFALLKKKLMLFSILLFGLISCQNKKYDFYSYSKRADLWRVPILEPYELISPTNTGDWFLIIINPRLTQTDYTDTGDGHEFQLTSIDSLGVVDSVIILKSKAHYWPRLGGDYKTTLIVDARTGENFIFSDQHHSREITEKLKSLGITEPNLHSFREIRKQFQLDMSLPDNWRQ